jgi:hypothetical protein
VGTTLARVLEGCGAHLDCDRFFGCALRLWLTHLAAHPWKRAVLRAQRVTRDVAAALRDARLQEATRLCGSADTFDALDKRTEPAAVGAARGLAYACAGAMQARLEGGIQTLEVLRTKLDPDAHGARCRELRAWRAPPWLPAQHPARERISRARALCDALDSQRPLAFAVRYAERDAALVKAALVAGRADDAAYHKCAHKGKTFATLQGSTLPRARAAAKILRRVCFERFGTAFLARHRRAGAAFEKRHCYKIRVVTALVTSHATPAVLSANLALVRWAKARCPAP